MRFGLFRGARTEIVERLERLRAGGIEYVLLIDVGGSLPALRMRWSKQPPRPR